MDVLNMYHERFNEGRRDHMYVRCLFIHIMENIILTDQNI